MDRGTLTEAAMTGALGSVFGFVATDWFGFGFVGAVVAGANGLAGGWSGIYDWIRPSGWVSFLADSTWGLVGTALGLLLGAANLLRSDRDYVGDLSTRAGRHVFVGGLGLRRGFALTQGNVVSNAGGSLGLRGESRSVTNRRRFVVEHEGLHVFQNRLFGPAFQILYGAWLVGAGLIGLMVAAFSRSERLAIIETFAYYNNPFEYWAYRNNKYWPPKDAVKRFAWPPSKMTYTSAGEDRDT